MSAKNITVITLDGREFRRTLKKARDLVAKGSHCWQGDFTVLELRPGSSHPDYARLLRPGALPAAPRPAVCSCHYIPTGLPAAELPGVYFVPPGGLRPSLAALCE